jgi:hypothetical protein
MITREQSERSEEAMRAVFENQFRVLTSQVLENLRKSLNLGENWPTKLLLFAGTILLIASLAMQLLMRIDYPGGLRLPLLSPIEFTTLILAATALLLVGALLSLFHAWGWRSIIRAQQVVGMEILNKQIDVDKELLTGKNRHQAGELILLPAKIHRRHRR